MSQPAWALTILYSLYTGHESLYHRARILHHDISMGNIMLTEQEDDGFLIDFDFAVDADPPESSDAQRRTGTKVFMSIDALAGECHSFMDDLESFFWVLFWICLHHEGPHDAKKTKKPFKHTEYEEWYYKSPDVLSMLKIGEEQTLMVIPPPYTEFCEPLVPNLEELRMAIFSNTKVREKGKRYDPEDEQLYFKMKSILEKARDTLEPNPSTSLIS